MFLIFLASLPAVASELSLRSGQNQAALIELYTSEGCSSCPPADQWFSRLLDHPSLWVEVVPVAFHVDYWNYLGWDDRFSKSRYATRQRRYHKEGDLSGVYPPGVLVAGREWRNWRETRPDFDIEGPLVGVLAVDVDGDAFVASFDAEDDGNNLSTKLTFNIALIGFDMKTSVKAGENSGRRLTHDFVVLGCSVYIASPGEKWRGELPETDFKEDAGRLAVVAWVSPNDSQRPVQAVGGWYLRGE